MAALLGVIERIAGLAVVTTRGGGRLAHLLLAVLEVDGVHGGGRVAQALRDGRARVCSRRLGWQRAKELTGRCRTVCATPNGGSGGLLWSRCGWSSMSWLRQGWRLSGRAAAESLCGGSRTYK